MPPLPKPCTRSTFGSSSTRPAADWLGVATTTLPATPCDFAGTPWSARWMAPEHGQHTDEVLTEFGFGAEEIADLRNREVI